MLWILNTGAQWHMLPQCYPNYKTVHRRFQRWSERDVLREVLCALANELREQGGLDESECFVDAMFSPAKGGGGGGGTIFGRTDEYGYRAIENILTIHDLHATILHQMGIDHEKLTYRYSGRDFRLTDVHGQVVRPVLA